MNRWIMSGALSVSLAALMIGNLPSEAPAQINGAWVKDYAQARQTAKQTGKPMLVVFR
jgi:hypothetical protein